MNHESEYEQDNELQICRNIIHTNSEESRDEKSVHRAAHVDRDSNAGGK